MTKNERELRLMIKRYGLEAGDFRQHNGKHIVDITAPNGTTKKFYFSVQTNDPHAAKNNDADLRRFARENQPEPMPVASIPPARVQPNSDAWLTAVPASLRPTFETTTQEATMTDRESTSHKKSEDPARQRNQLSAKEAYRLCEWCKTADLQGCYTFEEIAKRATASLATRITEANVKTAFDTVGLLLPQDPSKPTRAAKGTTTNERALARALVSLMQELGKDPGNDLLKIAA